MSAAFAAHALEQEFGRLREDHRVAVRRTVARASLPGSVTRVFAEGTKRELVRLLAAMPVDGIPQLADAAGFHLWFRSALRDVGATILRLNPPHVRPGIHPGYEWGHGAKVLSIFVRDLVLYSRYFTDVETKKIEPWLLCPIDGVVIEHLHKLGLDFGVTLIRELDETRFWRIQAHLARAATAAGVPAVWFDDVWSDRDD